MKFGNVIKRALSAGCVAALVTGFAAGSASASLATGASDPSAAQVTTQVAPKGQPPQVGSSTVPGAVAAPQVITTPADGMFQYAQASQFVFADGARGYFTIPKPILAPGDSHSLAELAVQSSDQRQVIEVGWTVDRALNGDDDPHLFVFHWIDGVRTCYNACGFVPFNEPGYSAGMKLPVTTTPTQFNILHHGAEWRVGYNGHWVGAFPDSEWGNRFKVAGLVQWFGEVASPTASSCTEMGNGQPAGSATAARIERIGFAPARVTPAIATFATSPDAYSVLRTGTDSMRFGGHGSCRTVPNLVGTFKAFADGVITTAGLVPGRATPQADRFCENINTVISQTPAAGTRVPSGSAVNYVFGERPKTPCP
jgi:hypothetical protein